MAQHVFQVWRLSKGDDKQFFEKMLSCKYCKTSTKKVWNYLKGDFQNEEQVKFG